jgi:hypothetical protein
MLRRALTLICAAAAASAALPASAPAATWTRVASSTLSDITAVDYQSPTRFWFATSAGEIFTRQPDGSFGEKFAQVGLSFDSIAFQPSGGIGFAVGANGVVERSSDSGSTWAPVAITASNIGCTNSTTTLGTITAVRFAGSNDAYLFSGGDQVVHARADGTHALGVTGDWADINRKTGGGCKAEVGGSADGYFLPTDPFQGYVMSSVNGTVFYSTDWSSQSSAQQKGTGTTVGGTSTYKRLAADPRAPTHQWAIDVGSDGLAPEFQRTLDGWQTPLGWSFDERGRTRTAGWDIAFGPGAATGGTVMSVGDAGQIESSTDGIDFYSVPAADAPTEAWRSVSLYDASDAAVGGLGGVLETSSDANIEPDVVAPTATGISGPALVTAGVAATYTLNASDEPGGSGLNSAATAWTVAGQPGQRGPSATYRFPSAGTYTVQAGYTDNAGNPGAPATLTVVVAPAVAIPPPPAKKRLPVGFAARGKSPVPRSLKTTGHGSHKTVSLKVSGKLRLPAGVSASRACAGHVRIVVSSPSKHEIASHNATVHSTCAYSATLTFRASKVKKKSVTISLSFAANKVVAASSYRKSLAVKT